MSELDERDTPDDMTKVDFLEIQISLLQIDNDGLRAENARLRAIVARLPPEHMIGSAQAVQGGETAP